jgi:hypothetical protein
MIITLLAHHIEWDTDGDNGVANSLPSRLKVEVDLQDIEGGWTEINSVICDQLSEATGWCVLDFQLEGYSAEADFALQMTLSNGE